MSIVEPCNAYEYVMVIYGNEKSVISVTMLHNAIGIKISCAGSNGKLGVMQTVKALASHA